MSLKLVLELEAAAAMTNAEQLVDSLRGLLLKRKTKRDLAGSDRSPNRFFPRVISFPVDNVRTYS